MNVLLLLLVACVPTDPLDEAWSGPWEVDSHLEGEGCGFPQLPAEPSWEALEVSFVDFEGALALSVARCGGGGAGCDIPTVVAPLRIAEDDLLLSDERRAAFLPSTDGPACNLSVLSVVADQETAGEMSLHIQQYFGFVPPPADGDCDALVEEIGDSLCDLTTRIEARR